MDVIKIMIDLYYTPKITTKEDEYTNKFYLTIEYVNHAICMQMPKTNYRLGKCCIRYYETKPIGDFIEQLQNNEECQFFVNDPFTFRMIVNKTINIYHEEVNLKISIKNTECTRQQLIDAMYDYYDFMFSYCDD